MPNRQINSTKNELYYHYVDNSCAQYVTWWTAVFLGANTKQLLRGGHSHPGRLTVFLGQYPIEGRVKVGKVAKNGAQYRSNTFFRFFGDFAE